MGNNQNQSNKQQSDKDLRSTTGSGGMNKDRTQQAPSSTSTVRSDRSSSSTQNSSTQRKS